MTSPVQAQATAQIAPGGGDSISLSFEQEAGIRTDLDVHLLLFPPVDATLEASAGKVRKGIAKTIDVAGGVITFNGGDTAHLPKLPVIENPVLKVLFAFDMQGAAISPGISLDGATGTLKANAPCTAAVSFTPYQTRALEVVYTPLVENLGTGTKSTFGTIAAFYPPRSMTTYQVEPFNIDLGQSDIELYRIFSNSVTTSEGEFERPPNYPASGSYPEKTKVLDTSQTLETERVHEIGFINERGYAFVREYFVRTLEPYIGDSAYAPIKKYRESGALDPKKYPKDLIAKAMNFIKSRGLGGTGLPSA